MSWLDFELYMVKVFLLEWGEWIVGYIFGMSWFVGIDENIEFICNCN